MKKHLLLVLLLTMLCQVYSQYYDLIVTTIGDSIACRIDSITDTHIYFEMLNKRYWVNTNVNKENVIEFQRNAINKKQAVFKEGTSIINKIRETIPQPTSIRDIQKNSISIDNTVFVLFGLSYERMFPLNNFSGIAIRGGIGPIFGEESDFYYLLGETKLLAGGPKQFFEMGISGCFVDFEAELIMIRAGFRYQTPKGFVFRAAPLFIYIPNGFVPYVVLPEISIGCAF
jgi:hypothetical protein